MAKCPPCKKGAPEWLATFSDLCTLLLTFFILLISMATFEKVKLQTALGSIRQAFGGQVLKQGETVMLGKTPENYFIPIEASDPPKPFPIEFLTSEGLLEDHEVFDNADEEMADLIGLAKDYQVDDQLEVYNHKEGINVKMKEDVLFVSGGTTFINFQSDQIKQIAKMVERHDWHISIQAIVNPQEPIPSGISPRELAFKRSNTVAQYLESIGVPSEKIVASTLFKKVEGEMGRVELVLKKTPPQDLGKARELQGQ